MGGLAEDGYPVRPRRPTTDNFRRPYTKVSFMHGSAALLVLSLLPLSDEDTPEWGGFRVNNV